MPKGLQSSQVQVAAFSPDGKTIAATGGALYFWDAPTGNYLGEIKFKQVGGQPTIAYSLDGRTIAVGSANGKGPINLFDVPKLRREKGVGSLFSLS
jgi:WD40 repeat protein